jgi:hypothetical protein
VGCTTEQAENFYGRKCKGSEGSKVLPACHSHLAYDLVHSGEVELTQYNDTLHSCPATVTAADEAIVLVEKCRRSHHEDWLRARTSEQLTLVRTDCCKRNVRGSCIMQANLHVLPRSQHLRNCSHQLDQDTLSRQALPVCQTVPLSPT